MCPVSLSRPVKETVLFFLRQFFGQYLCNWALRELKVLATKIKMHPFFANGRTGAHRTRSCKKFRVYLKNGVDFWTLALKPVQGIILS